MLTVPVFDMQAQRTGAIEVDPAWLGGRVRPRLIKQAVVAYLDHRRQYSARTKGRSDVEGSTRKLYRQKGTGNARMGTIRTPIRRGGGRTFAKRVPGSRKELPKKMRRLARDSALLAKIQAGEVAVVDELRCPEPKTRPLARLLETLSAALERKRGWTVAMHEYDRNVLLSGRNIPDADIRVVDDLNAYDVLRRKLLVFTRPALERYLARCRGDEPAAAEA